MAKYELDIAGSTYEVDAPDNATPDTMKQIAATILAQEKQDMEAQASAEVDSTQQATPVTMPESTTTQTATTNDPRTQLPSAGYLPSAIEAASGIAAPMVAGAIGAGSGGGLTLPGLAVGGAIAAGGQAAADWLRSKSFEGGKVSPARAAMAAPLAFIPVKNAKTIGGAIKAGLEAGGLTTAGISTADYFDTGHLPSLEKVGTDMFITTLLGTLGSRLGGQLERDIGPEAANTMTRAEDLTPQMNVPKDRVDDIKEIERATKTSKQEPDRFEQITLNTQKRRAKQKAKATGKIIYKSNEDFDFSSSRKTPTDESVPPQSTGLSSAELAKLSAFGRRAKREQRLTPEQQVREDIALEGLSAREGGLSDDQLLQYIQQDMGVPEAQRVKTATSSGDDEFNHYITNLASGEPRYMTSPIGIRGEAGLRPQAGVIQDLSSATGMPAFNHYAWLERQTELKRQYEDLIAGRGSEENWGLTRIFERTSQNKRAQMARWFKAPDDQRQILERDYNWNSKDIARAKQLAKFINARLDEYKDYDLSSLQGLDAEPDALKMVTRIVRVGSFKKFLGDQWEDIRKGYYGLSQSRTATETQRLLGNEMVKILDAAKGPPDGRFFIGLQSLVNKTIKRLGIPIEVDSHDVVDTMLNAQNLAYLAGNIPSLIRDSFQPVLTAYPKLGAKYFAKGIKLAMSKTGKEAAESAGITRGMTTGMHDVLSIAKGPISRAVQTVTKAGMMPRQMNESFGRSLVYNGMVAKAQDALREARKLEDPIAQVRRFIDLADIDRMHPEVQKEVAAHYLLRKPEDAIDYAARALVNETMFDYTSMARPKLIRNPAGKLGLTYGVWPAAYTEYLTNFHNFGPGWKVKRDRARLMLAHGAILGTFGSLGALAGDENAYRDAAKQVFWGPVSLTESGIGSLAYSAAHTLAGDPNAPPELKYKAKGFIPGSAAYRNIKDVVTESNAFRSAGRLVGFVRGHKKEDGTIQKPRFKTVKGPTEEESFFRRALPKIF